MGWLDPDLRTPWEEIEALLAEMRKKQKKRNKEMQEALMRQKVAEISIEMEWWPVKRKKKRANKYHTP